MATTGTGTPAVWEDFIDIFYAPSAVFARRMNGRLWIPLVVVTIALGALFFLNSGVLQPVFDAEFNRAMARTMRLNPQMTPEMADRARVFGARIALVGGFVFVPVLIFLTGTLLWLVGKLFEAKQAFRTAILVTSYAWVPRILEAVINGMQGLFLDPALLDGRYRLSLGIGRFLDPDVVPPVVLALVGRIDVFTIWVTVLLAIGLSVTGGISRTRAYVAAAIIWVCGALPALMQGMRG